MKKSFSLILSVVLIFQFIIGVGAYTFNENPLYTVEIPDGFGRVAENKFVSDDKGTFSVFITDNAEEKFCVADLDDSEMKEYAEGIAKSGEEGFKSLGMDGSVTVVSAEKLKHTNGKTALVMVFKATAKVDGKEEIRYEKMYEFTCIDNKFSFTYTPEKEEQVNDFDDCFNSIIINEAQIQSVGDKVTTGALYGGIILLLVLGIIRFIKPAKKKK